MIDYTLIMQVRPLNRVTHRSDAVIPQFDLPFHPHPPGFRPAPHSISLPSSPSGFVEHHLPAQAGDAQDLHRLSRTSAADEAERPPTAQQHARPNNKVMFRSQPIPGGVPAHMAAGRMNSRAGRAMHRGKYDSFKTFSGKLERQITHLAGDGGGVPASTPEEEDGRADAISGERTASIAPHVDRFFAALEGPELDTLKVS
jgi:hypothetical protein